MSRTLDQTKSRHAHYTSVRHTAHFSLALSALDHGSLSEAKLRLRPSDDHRILRVLAYRRALIIPLRLPSRQPHPTLANVATTRIILIVMHDRLPEFALIRASKAADLRAGHNELVVIKVVLMAFELRAYTQPLASVRIDVVKMMVVVAAEIILHPLPSIHQEVVVSMIVSRAIIIVDVLLRRIVINEEVVMYLPPRHIH